MSIDNALSNISNYYSVIETPTLALALVNPLQKIEGQIAPEYFIKKLLYQGDQGIEISNLICLLEKFSEKIEINRYAKEIWNACKVVARWAEESFSVGGLTSEKNGKI